MGEEKVVSRHMDDMHCSVNSFLNPEGLNVTLRDRQERRRREGDE